MWECGLKQMLMLPTNVNPVTPYVGVWIETCIPWYLHTGGRSHSLCGSVD